MSRTRSIWVGAALVLAAGPARADWTQTAAGPFDYNTTANWNGGAGPINGIFTQPLAADQMVTFAADTALTTGWTFNFSGAFNQTLASADANPHTVTLGGNVGMASVAGGRTTTIGDPVNVLNINLGGNRTFTVGGNDTLVFVNAVGDGAVASSLTRAGSGTLTLSGAGNYTGGTTLSAGTLNVASTGGLGAGALAVNGGSLKLSNAAQTVSQLSGSGGSIALNGTALTVDYSGSSPGTTYSGVISGTGSLIKSGSGMLTLSGNNTYSGGTTITAGQLSVSTTGVLGNGVLRIDGGTLILNSGSTVKQLSGTGGGVSITAGGGLGVNQTTDTTYAGTISATGSGSATASFAKLGAGKLTLSGSITSSSDVSVTGGALEVTGGFAANAVAVSGATLSLPGSGTATAGRLSDNFGSNGVIALNGTVNLLLVATTNKTSFFGTTYSGVINGTGRLTMRGSYEQVLNGANTYSGSTTLEGGTLTVSTLANGGSASGVGASDSSSANLVFGGSFGSGGTLKYTGATVSIDRGATLNGTSTIDVSTAGSTLGLVGGVGGSGSLTKTGAGNLTLSGNATYSGSTTVSAGTLTLSGSGNSYSGGTNLNGGVLSVSSNVNLGNASGALNFNGGTLRITGTGFTSTARSIAWGANGGGFDIADPNNTFTVSQLLSGGGGLTKAGAGTLVLTAINTYTGATNINGGVLQLGANALVTPGGTISIANGAELRAAGYVPRAFVGGGGTVTATGALLLGDLSSPTGYTFPGTLKAGSNTVELLSAGKASLGSQTTLGAGGLLVTINGALLGGGANGNTVDPSRLLTVTGGTGTVQGAFTNNGRVDVAAGARLVFQNLVDGAGGFAGDVTFNGGWSPGNSPAAVTLQDAVLGQFNTLTMELGGTTAGSQYDTITISGILKLGGALNVTAVNGFAPEAGDGFRLFDGTTTGTFSLISLPSLSGGLVWDITGLYTNGIISVRPVPEPVPLVLAAFGLAGLIATSRVRRGSRNIPPIGRRR